MRFAVVGSGFGEQHVGWLASIPGVTIEALCYQKDRSRAARVAEQFGIPTVESDPATVLRSGRVDAVSVVTPPQTHEEILMAGLDAGLTVVSDKPLAADGAAAGRLARRAEELDAAAFVTFQWRSNRALRKVAALRRDGFFGRILQGDLEFHHDFLGRPETPWPWRHDRRSAGAGTLADQGVHLFDLLRWLIEDEWVVEQARSSVAFAQRRHQGIAVSGETEDLADVWLTSASGVPARVFTSRVSAHRQVRVEVHGTEGSAIVLLDPDDGSGRLRVLPRDGDGYTQDFPADAMNIYELLLAKENRPADVPTFTDGARAQQLLDEVIERVRKPAKL